MALIGPVASEEMLFKIVDDGRRRRWNNAHPISSPGVFGSGELKKKKIPDLPTNLILACNLKHIYFFSIWLNCF